MAEIEITVEKAHVSYVQPGLWNINMHLTATDGGATVIDKGYSSRFRKGDRFDSKAKEITMAMQRDVDKYYNERFIYSDKDIDVLVTAVQAGLDLSEPTELNEIRRKVMQKKTVSKKSRQKKIAIKTEE